MTIESMFTSENHIRVRIERQKTKVLALFQKTKKNLRNKTIERLNKFLIFNY
jgi:hypothetical protein